MATEAKRTLALGVLVDLGDGLEHRLVFDFEALERIEDEWGGIMDYIEALNGGWRTKRLRAVRTGLYAALSHDIAVTRAQLDRLLSTYIGERFHDIATDLANPLVAAFDEAIPPPPKTSTSKASARVKPSPGPDSTEQQSATTDAALASSAV